MICLWLLPVFVTLDTDESLGMYLIIDQGNTRIKIAVFGGDEMLFHQVAFKRYGSNIIPKILSQYDIKAAIISHTSEVDDQIFGLCRNLPFFIHLDHNTPIPIRNQYASPESLGKDRIAAAVGCQKKFPNKNVLFIDMGTCITTNFLTSDGIFLGGNISPGIRMRLKAMHTFTARLPMAPQEIPDDFFGTTTIAALQNGAIKGTFREIDTFIMDTGEKFGEIHVVLTGGDANLFENYTKNKIFVAPNLVLEGLNEILKYNVKKN
jgi:type III pantothenate kinase